MRVAALLAAVVVMALGLLTSPGLVAARGEERRNIGNEKPYAANAPTPTR
jgi:hypothetical protein